MCESMESELDIINLEDVVKNKAFEMLSKDEQKLANVNNPVINWNLMVVTHDDAQYVQMTDYKEPSSNILFTSTFKNNTPLPKIYTLRTERKTTSVYNVTFRRTHTYGKSLNLTLTPPSSVIGASVGFKKDISKENGLADSNGKELTWSVDSEIQVPSGFQTTADLIIEEEQYSGNFTIKCTFEGDILVTYEANETKQHVRTVCGSVKGFFNGEEFTIDDKGNPVFLVKGVCHCKYGIKQNVCLTEERIPTQSDSKKEIDTSDKKP